MKLRTLLFVLLCVMYAGVAAVADEAAGNSTAILLKPSCSNWTFRDYKVDVAVKGRVPAPEGTEMLDVDSNFKLQIREKYTRREDDGLMPLEVSVTKGEAVIRDKASDTTQTMAVAPGTYPKLTVLLDRDCRPTDIFGVANTRYAEGLPGLNYANMVILFIPDMGGQPRKAGEKWETSMTVPSYKETYHFVNTLKSVDTVAKTAVVSQEISWHPKGDEKSTVKAYVESVFSTEDAQLVKSHAECRVAQVVAGDSKESASSQQEPTPGHTNTSIDISLIK